MNNVSDTNMNMKIKQKAFVHHYYLFPMLFLIFPSYHKRCWNRSFLSFITKPKESILDQLKGKFETRTMFYIMLDILILEAIPSAKNYDGPMVTSTHAIYLFVNKTIANLYAFLQIKFLKRLVQNFMLHQRLCKESYCRFKIMMGR